MKKYINLSNFLNLSNTYYFFDRRLESTIQSISTELNESKNLNKELKTVRNFKINVNNL